MILAMDKEKADAVLPSIGGHFSKAIAPINFDRTIVYSYNSVKIKRRIIDTEHTFWYN